MSLTYAIPFDKLTSNSSRTKQEFYDISVFEKIPPKTSNQNAFPEIFLEPTVEIGETADSFQKSQLSARLDAIDFPIEWIKEGIKPINIKCKELAEDIIFELLENYELTPARIAPSIESAC